MIRSGKLAQQGATLIESSLSASAYRVLLEGEVLRWRAPPGAGFPDSHTEPEAGLGLRLLVKLLGPLAPEEML